MHQCRGPHPSTGTRLQPLPGSPRSVGASAIRGNLAVPSCCPHQSQKRAGEGPRSQSQCDPFPLLGLPDPLHPSRTQRTAQSGHLPRPPHGKDNASPNQVSVLPPWPQESRARATAQVSPQLEILGVKQRLGPSLVEQGHWGNSEPGATTRQDCQGSEDCCEGWGHRQGRQHLPHPRRVSQQTLSLVVGQQRRIREQARGRGGDRAQVGQTMSETQRHLQTRLRPRHPSHQHSPRQPAKRQVSGVTTLQAHQLRAFTLLGHSEPARGLTSPGRERNSSTWQHPPLAGREGAATTHRDMHKHTNTHRQAHTHTQAHAYTGTHAHTGTCINGDTCTDRHTCTHRHMHR